MPVARRAGLLPDGLFLFGFGLYGHGVFLAELQRLNGWPAAPILGASTLSLLLANIFATFTPELVARLGPKRLVLFGLAALAASMVLLAWRGRAVAALCRLRPDVARLDRDGHGGERNHREPLVRSRRGLAISLAFTGASFSGVIVTPLLV